MTRLSSRFAALAQEKRSALITFVTAGDPDEETSRTILNTLPEVGADVVELGMPFSDPVADGPAIQRAAQRAILNGQTCLKTLEMAREFRRRNKDTPLILMGYYNPIHAYGPEKFFSDAGCAGVDGMIIVDLPLEMQSEVASFARQNATPLIQIITPTTKDARLEKIVSEAEGFLYCVSVAGVTGTATFREEEVRHSVLNARRATSLPIVVGFGIRTEAQITALAAFADGVVVGSVLVETIEKARAEGQDPVNAAQRLIKGFSGALQKTRPNLLEEGGR